MKNQPLPNYYELCDHILDVNKSDMVTLTIDQFQRFCEIFSEGKPIIQIDIVNNGTWAYAQFSEISNCRIRIFPVKRKNLLESDFLNLGKYKVKVYGFKKPFSFINFLVEEFQVNWIVLTIIYLLFSITLFFAVKFSESTQILIISNELIIEITTVFIGIFIIFTVAQNLKEIIKKEHIITGIFYRFVSIDKYLSWLGFIAILIAYCNRILLDFSNNFVSTKSIIQQVLPFITGISFILMVDLFLSIPNYYIDRQKEIICKDISDQILDEVKRPKQ